MMKRHAMTIMATVVMSAMLGGCGSPYTNIPALPGDTVAWHDPNGSTVLNVEAASIKYLVMQNPPPHGYAIELPAGTADRNYTSMMKKLPQGAVKGAAAASPEQPVFRIAQVQVRGLDAEVDVVRSGPGAATDTGAEQLVSTYLSIDIDGWYVSSSRVWHVPVDQALSVVRSNPTPAKEQAKPKESDTTSTGNSKGPDAAVGGGK